ncbi:MAG TPA: HNH endonuclease family protein, partial [Treponemataceae bacterium]|nr:HNH endonuclease family protein [Treponemataceae bacterium]
IDFIKAVTDHLFFTVITVTDELNAFKVFETLNARGVQLSSSDLLKNYIFSIADSESLHRIQLESLENSWAEIAGILKKGQVSEYLRFYWNSYHTTVRKNQLYKIIRDEVKTPDQAFSLIRDMRKKAEIYSALQDPSDELWVGKEEIQKNLELLQVFNITQPLSLLLSAYDFLDEKTFSSLLSKIVILSFRYNIICGKNPNEQEKVYNRIAVKISSQKKFDASELKDSAIYISDEEFEQSFSYKEFPYSTRNNKIVKYILARLEKFESASSFDLDSYTLEHILPDNPDEESWPWDDRKIQLYRYRLGNMTLLETAKNNHIGNASFSEKQEVYKKSSVPSTKTLGILDTKEWKEKNIDDRQRKMAREAKGIWKI